MISYFVELVEIGGATAQQQLLKLSDELPGELHWLGGGNRCIVLCCLIRHVVDVDV
jgi:hypothetical protein